jgi:hypothetical protein
MRDINDKNWFINSITYKEMQRLMNLDVSSSKEDNGDSFIANFMRPDLEFDNQESEVEHLRSAQAILRDEILTAYSFMEAHGILKDYKEYKNL